MQNAFTSLTFHSANIIVEFYFHLKFKIVLNLHIYLVTLKLFGTNQ